MPQLSTFHSQLSAFPAALPYNSELSLWLSVDPLSDKYPGSSPYVYCADNPVRLVDVDGREIWIPPFIQQCVDQLKNDGYWDPIEIGESLNLGPVPDGKGPNRELRGGHPYEFKEQQRTFTFKNPGYNE